MRHEQQRNSRAFCQIARWRIAAAALRRSGRRQLQGDGLRRRNCHRNSDNPLEHLAVRWNHLTSAQLRKTDGQGGAAFPSAHALTRGPLHSGIALHRSSRRLMRSIYALWRSGEFPNASSSSASPISYSLSMISCERRRLSFPSWLATARAAPCV